MKKYFLSLLLLVSNLTVNYGQIISTIGGNGLGGFAGDGGPAVLANIAGVGFVCIDERGLLHITDNGNFRIRTIDGTGIINTISGNGSGVFAGDGSSALLAGQRPRSLVIDKIGNIIFADGGNFRLRRIDTSGIITTIAGTGTMGFSGDGGPATAAQLGNSANFLALDKTGRIYLSDNNRIRRIDTSGNIATIAGTGIVGYTGDGAPAIAASFNGTSGIALDDTGNIYVVDQGNYCIRKINTSGIISTIAGTGTSGYTGDGGAALIAQLKKPFHVATDLLNNIYLSEYDNGCVRKINTAGIITTIAGTGTLGFSGDGGPATLAMLNRPQGLFADSAGNIYIGDASNARVRKISANNHMPSFTRGRTQSINACENTVPISLDTLLAVMDADAGQTLNWTLSVAPSHGVAAVMYSALSTSGLISPAGLTYLPTAGYWGNDSFTVRIDDGITAYKTIIYVSIVPFHSGVIVGADTICLGDTTVFLNATSGGVWSSSNPLVASIGVSGQVTALSVGSSLISFTVANSCGVVSSTHPLIVLPWSEHCLTAVAPISANTYPFIKVYPNPSSDKLLIYLQTPLPEFADIMIVDVTGNVIYSTKVPTNMEVNLSDKTMRYMNSGLYTIRAITAHGTWYNRFVLSR